MKTRCRAKAAVNLRELDTKGADMSSPEPELQKQKRRHRGPLIGMAVVLAFVAILFFGWSFWSAQEATPPEGADVQIDGRTGEPATD
jgi:hypothetical protein